MQLIEPTRGAAKCIHPAEIALNFAVGDFERNGEMGIVGEGVSSDESESEYLNTIVHKL